MTKVTDKMVDAANDKHRKVAIECGFYSINASMIAAIEAALAERDHVIEDLIEALRPFAAYADLVKSGSVNWVPDGCPVTANIVSHEYELTVGDIRRAYAILTRMGVKL